MAMQCTLRTHTLTRRWSSVSGKLSDEGGKPLLDPSRAPATRWQSGTRGNEGVKA